jgi:outer membrane protein OmpA-like peptidoglycan-associated protein
MSKALVDHSDYLMILHGHANPVTYSQTELAELMSISTARANAVNVELKTKFSQLSGDVSNWDTRVSANGYGGEKNLSVTNSTYAGLNRRVEMILVRVGI